MLRASLGNRRLVWIQSPTNPTLRVVNVPRIVKFVERAKERQIFPVDKTVSSASPLRRRMGVVPENLTDVRCQPHSIRYTCVPDLLATASSSYVPVRDTPERRYCWHRYEWCLHERCHHHRQRRHSPGHIHPQKRSDDFTRRADRQRRPPMSLTMTYEQAVAQGVFFPLVLFPTFDLCSCSYSCSLGPRCRCRRQCRLLLLSFLLFQWLFFRSSWSLSSGRDMTNHCINHTQPRPYWGFYICSRVTPRCLQTRRPHPALFFSTSCHVACFSRLH